MRNKTAKKTVPADSLNRDALENQIAENARLDADLIAGALAIIDPERLVALKEQAGGEARFDLICGRAAMEVRGMAGNPAGDRFGFAMLRIIQFCGSHPTADDVRRAVGEAAAAHEPEADGAGNDSYLSPADWGDPD